MTAPRITRVKAICTAPDGIRLVVVKIETSEPGLYGLGCATFTQRPLAVVTAIDEDLEPYKLFFLEDIFAPEDNDYFRILRQQSTIAIAMGELYVNQHEYVPLIRDRLIDFIRVHISDIGGLSMARKLAAFCEFFGVRTAWHGPGDVSPVGHAANLQLDLACHNFGIQEQHEFGERTREVFPGCPEIRDGALWSNDLPGLGIDIDETLAARYPFPDH